MPLIDKVKIPKNELMDRMVENRANHIRDVKELRRARRLEIQEKLEEVLAKMASKKKWQPKQSYQFPLQQSYEEEYDRAIQMVEMTTDEVIELTEQQFDQLVLDNWGWKHEMVSNTMRYAGKMR